MPPLDTLVRAAAEERLAALPAPRPASAPTTGRRPGSRRPSARALLTLLAFAVYLGCGLVLVYRYDVYFIDEQARVANAYYVMFSADPHLAAIGFVWNPLVSLSQLPLLALSPLFPDLAARGLAAVIMGALFMALAVRQLDLLLAELHLSRRVRLVSVLLLAANPMVLLYGANGMSESLYLLFLLMATRRLAQWLQHGRTSALALAGLALALGYLTRNETTMAAVLAAGVVVTVSVRRAPGNRSRRWATALTDATVLLAPPAAAFVAWAGISWVIVGHPFAQVAGQYGVAASVQALRADVTFAQRPEYALHEVLWLAPGLAPAALMAIALLVRRTPGSARALAAAAVLGGPLVFSMVAAVQGKTLGWLRFYILAIPLCSVLAIATAASVRRRGLRTGAVLLALALAAVGIPSGVALLTDKVHAPEEHLQLAALWTRYPGPEPLRKTFDVMQELGRTVDGLGGVKRTVLMDNAESCLPSLVLRSRHPKQFVIPNDRRFQAVLANPFLFRVRYIITAPTGGLGRNDAVNIAYPTLYESGGGFAELVREFRSPRCPPFRLYRVLQAPPGAVG
jgi:hypothetical protein